MSLKTFLYFTLELNLEQWVNQMMMIKMNFETENLISKNLNDYNLFEAIRK